MVLTGLGEVLGRLATGLQVIDLSVPLAENVPCGWPGNQTFQAEGHWFENAEIPYAHQVLAMDEHTGTHFDAPAHFVPPDNSPLYRGRGRHITSEQIALSRFMGPARILDATAYATDQHGQSPWIGVDALETLESMQGEIQPGEVLLVWTGWSDRHYRPLPAGRSFVEDAVAGNAPGWPALSPELVHRVRERGVGTIGIDTPSFGAAQDSFGPHLAALENEMVVIEELTSLGRLPAQGAFFLFLPLSVVGGSGAPGRAVALVPA